MSLRVTAVQIRDVLGARTVELAPGKITVLSGRNGSGKSTALGAIQAALGGGNLARLARVAAPGEEETEPEVVLVLDGDEHLRVERVAGELRVRRRVGESAALEDVPRPQAFLDALMDGACANPAKLLLASDAELALLLLEALPLAMDREGLSAAVAGVDKADWPHVPSKGLHALEEVGLWHAGIYTSRTAVNRDAKQKASTAEQLRRQAPAVEPESLTEDLSRAIDAAELHAATVATMERAAASDEAGARAIAQGTYEALEALRRGEYQAEARRRKAAHDTESERMIAQVQEAIASKRVELDRYLSQLRDATDAGLDAAADVRYTAEMDATRARALADQRVAGARVRLDAARAEVATLRGAHDLAGRGRVLHDQAKQFDAEAEALALKSGAMTAALDALDALRRRLAEDLPIKGLSIEGKAVLVDGIPIRQVNTAKRVDICVQIACLRAGRLPVVFVDGAEALDSENFGLLVERLAREPVQAFLARVGDLPFGVDTFDEVRPCDRDGS